MLKGDAEPWRDVGHARWFDPLAALEDTQGPAFRAALSRLETQWTRTPLPHLKSWSSRIKHFQEAALPEIPAYAQDVFTWKDTEIRIQHAPAHRLNVWMDTTLKYKGITAFGVDSESDLYFVIEDVGAGAELLEISVYRIKSRTPVFQIKPVGPDAAFTADNRIAYLTVDNALRYDSVVTVRKDTGGAKRILYESKDPRCQLEILAGKTTVFVRECNALEHRIGSLTDASVHWMCKMKPTSMVPLSKKAWIENRHLVLGTRRVPLPHGEFIEDAALWTDIEILIVTVKAAACSLYFFNTSTHRFTTLIKNETPTHIRISHHSPTVLLSYPNKPSEVWDVRDRRSVLTMPEPLSLAFSVTGAAKSADGTRVPYTIVSKGTRSTKLIVEAYGAYGISGHRAYPVQWLHYLERGYALAIVFPRGGRENGDAWWEDGKVLKKKNTFEDVYAAIQTVQRRLRIPVSRTLFYGRSAGGWVAARVAQHEPPLVRAVFAEVPYVDVLRTTSNPRLPLTQMEYEEFGDPRRVADYKVLRALSPIDTVPLAPVGAPVVLARTALHDMEVSPYEAIKWVTKLQSLGFTALLGCDRHGGHFAAAEKSVEQAAENAAFLDSHLSHRGAPATRKASRGMTANSTRRKKHRTVQSTSAAAS